MRESFINAIKSNQSEFAIKLSENVIERLGDYYEVIQESNPILHLVGPCSPGEFATRHILESLTLLESLPTGASFADVGAGAGLPSIPCLIARDDLSAVLIESKEKKVKFLEEVLPAVGISERARVVNRQFEEVEPVGFDYVTCRALDKFVEKLPRLLKWARGKRVRFFAGNSMLSAIEGLKIPFDQKLMPLSSQRFLIATRGRV